MGESGVIPGLSEFELTQISEGNFENLSYPLTDWHRQALENVSTAGIECLIFMWFTEQPKFPLGTFCNATWDNFYCWPPTPAGVSVMRPCSTIFGATNEESTTPSLIGQAIRVCLDNSVWLWGNWTNYSKCADELEAYEMWRAVEYEEEVKLLVRVRYILFIGSILSLVCQMLSLFIFYYFKCLRCDRVKIHVHLMIALTLRCILLVIITEPFIFHRTNQITYLNLDFTCKTVLSINLYATVASIFWMFLEGAYLHGKVTSIFDRGTQFKYYYAVGWGLPIVLISGWVASMELFHPVKCWKDYSRQPYIWMLLGPMILALVGNLCFLINIMRILLTKIELPNAGDVNQLRRVIKATMVLFPLLGMNNLLFLYNPFGDGSYQRTFVIFNTGFQSTQGILVSILYCFLSSDVRDAVCRRYKRFKARRGANNAGRNPANVGNSNNGNERCGLDPVAPLEHSEAESPSLEKIKNSKSSEAPPDPSPNTIDGNNGMLITNKNLTFPTNIISSGVGAVVVLGGKVEFHVITDSRNNRVSIPLGDWNSKN